jgi:hypothetical protein
MVAFSGVMALATSVNEAAQVPTSKAGEMACQFSEMYRSEGWKIPGRSGAVPKGSSFALSVSPGGVIPGVFVTEMKSGKALSNLLFPKCSPDSPGRLIVREGPVRVLHMSKVDYQGRVFAYIVEYEPQIVESGKPTRTLGFVQVVFLDTDGSGRFSVMKYDDRGFFLASPDVPEWAKRPSQKPPTK